MGVHKIGSTPVLITLRGESLRLVTLAAGSSADTVSVLTARLVLRPLREWLFITKRPARVLAGEAPRYRGEEAVREALGLTLEAVGFG